MNIRLSLSLLSLLGIAQSFASTPHPVSAVPDFHCIESESVCLEQAHTRIRESFDWLNIDQAEKPDLHGPSDYWGRGGFTEFNHRTPVVAILMHGMYEDGRQLAPEAAWLAEHGIPVLNIVLSGHGSTNELANEVVYQDYIEDAERALRLAHALGDRAILVGHSTGGVLSVYLGIKYPDAVAAAILIEPAVRVSTIVQTAACVSQHGISNIADYPNLLKIYGTKPEALHNRVIAPSAGCEVHLLRDAALSLVANDRRGSSELDHSRALGREFKAPLLLFNNQHDLVVDPANNDAFAEGAAAHGVVRKIDFNPDHKMPHGSIVFSHPEMIISEMSAFLQSHGLIQADF